MAVTRVGILSAALLSIVSYYDEADQPAQKARMQKALAGIQPSVNGPWSLSWGPALNDGVLAFVARGADGRYALALRGTLSDLDAKGLFANIIDDLDSLELVPFLYPQSAGANIAAGSNDALALLIATTDPATGLGLIDYLRRAAAANGGTLVLDVVGHSLGGDLATLASAWLVDQLPKAAQLRLTVTPYTFAAPTTGDQGFATLWNRLFGTNAYAAVNANDIVPMAWNQLWSVQKTYQPQNGPTLWDYSPTVWFAVGAAAEYLQVNAIAYVPVTPSQLDGFSGPAFLAQYSWADCAAQQHGLTSAYVPHVWFGWGGDLSATPPPDAVAGG
jgi:lipase (class 3)